MESVAQDTAESRRARGGAVVQRLVALDRSAPPAERRQLWVTVGLCSNAPDWVGPAASLELGIPYVLIEPVTGPRAADRAAPEEREAARMALQSAQAVVTSRSDTARSLRALMTVPARLTQLPPFLDVAPYLAASQARDAHRWALASHFGLPHPSIWLITAGPQQEGAGLDSYRMLALALSRITFLEWHLLVVGGGEASKEVRAALRSLPQQRLRWWPEATSADRSRALAASDLYVWPTLQGVGADSLLEAQAAGTPVLACREPGVADRVIDGRTGRLAADNAESLANGTSFLLRHPTFRLDYGRQARHAMVTEHDLHTAAATFRRILAQLR